MTICSVVFRVRDQEVEFKWLQSVVRDGVNFIKVFKLICN